MRADTTRLRRAPGQPPLVLGHRGVRGLGSGTPPENTLEAFALAADAGADGVELDVRTCATGELLVFHDPALARMTHGGDTRKVAELSFDELRRVDLGGGMRIPLLDDVLAWAGERALIVNIEMKSDVPDRGRVVHAVTRALARRGSASASAASNVATLASARSPAIVVSSFDPLMLARFAVANRTVVCGLLFHRDQWLPMRSGWLAPLLGVEAVHPDHVLVDARTIRAWKGALVNVWTVNDDAEATRLASLGVDAIITDDPARIGKAVRATSGARSSG